MQKLVTYGLVTSLCALLMSACADSGGERPGTTAGTGGTGGTGGGAGGTGGAPTGGTGGATGGTGGGAPVVFPAACSGCVELTVVTTGAGQQAQYLFRVGGTTTYDFTNALVTFRVRRLTPASEIPGEQIFVTPFAQNGQTPDNYAGVFRPQTVLSDANGFANDAWVDVTLDMANTAPYGEIVTPPPPPVGGGADAGADAGDAGGVEEPTGPVVLDNNNGTFNKALVFQYGIQVGTLATATAFGNVRVALDSVTYKTPDGAAITALPDQTFTTALEGIQLDGFETPPGTQNPVFRP